ncbi:CHAT domain-containing protein [Neolewinella antarctica]|uniref:CHAT domain-containing protein n=1 Tax=Neolewinella antarctica TaxID=442734 RepID=A0ABX0XE65_9BACT|nr:CHAT domain-containing tetratricopeptide repeat protein [Neolewinella antarctica]NJC27595.1 CHAT domain-containing protein [Neolewinella antarctica]
MKASFSLLAFLLAFGGCAGGVFGQEDGLAERQTLVDLGNALYNDYKEKEALLLYQQVTHNEFGELITDSLTGLAFHKMGACYEYIHQKELSAQYYRRAIAFRDSVLCKGHPETTKSMSNLGSAYLKWGQIDSANYFLHTVIDRYRSNPRADTLVWIKSLINLGSIAVQLQDRQLLLDVATRASELLAATTESLPAKKALAFHYNLALHASKLRLSQLARQQADRALSISVQMEGTPYLSAIHNVYHIADYYAGDRDGAIRHLRRAIDLYEKNDREELRIYLYNMALLHLEGADYAEAKVFAQRALGYAQAELATKANILSTLATATAGLGDNKEAALLYSRGLAAIVEDEDYAAGTLFRPRLAGRTPEQLRQLSVHLEDRAVFLARSGHAASALLDYQDAIEASNRLRTNVSSDASRRYLSQDVRGLYNAAVRLNVQLYLESDARPYAWQALLLSDQARAYTLNATLQADNQTLPAREAELNRRIGRLEATAIDDPKLKSELVTARLERDRLRRRSAKTQVRDTTELTQMDIIAYLQKHQTTLFQYHVTADTSLAFRVTPAGEISVHYLPGAARLSASAKGFREVIRHSVYRRQSLRDLAEQSQLDNTFITSGSQLARSLVPGEWGAQSPSGDKLLLIPDGALSFFPFAALPMSEEEGAVAYNSVRYLGTERTIRNAYSLTTLLANDERKIERRTIVAMGPTFTGALGQLSENAREVNTITASVTDANPITGPKASREAFLTESPTAGVLHLSTHGFSDAANPNQSWIAFSQSGSELDPEQLLYYPEIATLPISAEMVVLSACETSLGKSIPGETSLSIASAFTAAGARSTVNTLWRVDDRATADLMIAFYAELKQGKDRAEALRNAQRQLIDGGEFAHPYYWAGVTLTGADGPVELSDGGINRWLALLGGGILVGLVLGFRNFFAPATAPEGNKE